MKQTTKIIDINVKIETMQIKDIPDVIAIENASFTTPWSAEAFFAELSKAHSYFVCAKYEGEVVGYAGCWHIADQMHIVNLAVKKNFRQRGIGKKLISYLIAWAKQAKIKLATLEVRVSNISAIRLYESFGFAQVGIRRQYYKDNNEDAIIMSLEL